MTSQPYCVPHHQRASVCGGPHVEVDGRLALLDSMPCSVHDGPAGACGGPHRVIATVRDGHGNLLSEVTELVFLRSFLDDPVPGGDGGTW